MKKLSLVIKSPRNYSLRLSFVVNESEIIPTLDRLKSKGVVIDEYSVESLLGDLDQIGLQACEIAMTSLLSERGASKEIDSQLAAQEIN